MISKIMKTSISLVFLGTSVISTQAFAGERSTSLVSTLGAQSFGSSLGSVSEFNIGSDWLDSKWKGQTSYYTTKSQDVGRADSNQWSVDITRRLLSTKKNTYLAMGVGWNDIEMPEGKTSVGMRFIANGRVGIIGSAYLFGQASLSPWMSDAGNLVDPYGKEIALGLAVEPIPSFSLRAGYRGYWLNADEAASDSSLRSQTDGFFIGGGLRW